MEIFAYLLTYNITGDLHELSRNKNQLQLTSILTKLQKFIKLNIIMWDSLPNSPIYN